MNTNTFSDFRKGVNLGGWLSQCSYAEEHLKTFITESDIKEIASWGADHVRIPFDYNIIQNTDGTMIGEGFSYLDNAIEWCKKYGLRTVLDLHKAMGYSFDTYSENESGFFTDEKLQEYFYILWEEMAKRYGSLTDSAAFELLNEVTLKDYCTTWNGVIRKCIERIRRYAPDIRILVGSYWNNSPDAVPDLDKPYDDKIVYNMHCYSPLKFTHQGAYWTDLIDPKERISFEESGVTDTYFEETFRKAIEKAEKEGAALYCGEYGVIDVATPEDTVKWYRAIHKTFEKYGISRSAWSYKKMDFGLSDERLAGVAKELRELL
ncbi:MAG: glycoside hydrolase family 5 protein [Oscillospiraceae bacterium]|nr:glycoside hydrolase family 5 protein [Oscillospiraceae bacterium]